eukprot:TRINITY_DN5334_c0_g1_i2.p1 TRINITY_DN5334_c0_g1~~TRINITY_DN5334_c0_g1_i2.p1  ORF type:complete len:336 (-),score=65.94 TRINITY_DN5334_c0_g1_i2:158-1165(-)
MGAKAKPKAKSKLTAKPKLKGLTKSASKAKAKGTPKATVSVGKGPGSDAKQVKPDDPLAHAFYGDTQGFIAVKTGLASKILEDGYKVEVRDHVPCSSVPATSVKGLTANWPDAVDCTVLEVHGVPAKTLDVKNGRILTKHLSPNFLRDGVFKTRGAAEYKNVPCPLCGKKLDDKADQRGQVGLRRYMKQAFMVTPCDNAKCVELQAERQMRLNSGKTLWLYHITDKESAALIRDAGGKMLRGSGGNAGGAIYFGLSAKDAAGKALHHGVILKCRVSIGSAMDHDKLKGHTFAGLIKKKHDCVWGKIGYKTKSYIVYSWDQVSVAAEVDKDDNVIG